MTPTATSPPVAATHTHHTQSVVKWRPRPECRNYTFEKLWLDEIF